MWPELEALVNRQPVDVARDNGSIERVWVKSLLDQLAEAVQGTEVGQGASSGKPTSRPPISIDVIQLNIDISEAVRSTFVLLGVAPSGDHATDVRIIGRRIAQTEAWSARFAEWAQRIRDATGVEKPRQVAISIQCPSCGESWVSVTQGDEIIRRRAVYVTLLHGKVQSFSCSNCDDAAGLLSAMVDDELRRLVA
jgi:hypothetical protein